MNNAVSPLTKIKAYEDALKGLLDTAGKVWTEGTADALRQRFSAIKAQAVEIVATGHVKALEAVGKTPETLKDILDLDTPVSAKDEIVHAIMAHFSIGDELYRVVEANEVSPSTMLALHLQLTAEDPHDNEVTCRLRGLPNKCFIQGFLSTFALRAAADVEEGEFLKTLECLKLYINQSATLGPDIDTIAANLDQLRPGLEIVRTLYSNQDDPLGYKARIVTVVSMAADFWVGLYETTQDPLIKSMATIAFKRPEGVGAWQTYERIGLAHSPKWHMNAQFKAHGLTLITLYEHAIMTDDIDIITAERPDEQISSAIFKRYVNMLERVPITSKLAQNKAQFLVDKLVTHCKRNADANLIDVLVNSSIDPSFFARHYQILGNKFAADLGM